jgi:integrase
MTAEPPQKQTDAARSKRDVAEGGQSLMGLVEGWWQEARAAGRKPSTYESYSKTFAGLVSFLGHDDAIRVTRDDIVRFKDHRLTTPSPRTGKAVSAKTVKDSDLSGLKAVFDWAVMNGKLAENPAAKITIKVGKRPRLRSKGFTDQEAKAILAAALAHKPGRENAGTAAAKKWVPWLCAFTGARVGEIAQLRKQDVTQRGDLWVIRITPEAGTVKTNEAREVVLHTQLVELGFPEFVTASPDGHLFLTPAPDGTVRGPLRGLKNRLAEFARAIVPDPHVAPNHGWRHRFKTIGMEVGIAPRILDAIQGQAPRSVADSYGDVTLRTLAAAISKVPAFDMDI